MSRTVAWMRDKLTGQSLELTQYYRTFNAIYYEHKKPTDEMCSILNITMDRAEKLRREGYKIENSQRNDVHNFCAKGNPVDYEKVTNRKKPLPTHIIDDER
jgi:hypothetical protein